jgi:hypothetical protein
MVFKKLHVRFEVFTAVTMKNVVFWDIKTQFVLHRRHITYELGFYIPEEAILRVYSRLSMHEGNRKLLKVGHEI